MFCGGFAGTGSGDQWWGIERLNLPQTLHCFSTGNAHLVTYLSRHNPFFIIGFGKESVSLPQFSGRGDTTAAISINTEGKERGNSLEVWKLLSRLSESQIVLGGVLP